MKSTQISITNDLSELGKIVVELDEIAEAWQLPTDIVFNLNLVIEELISNTISYGYDKEDKNQEIWINISVLDQQVILVIEDCARAFNPLEKENKIELDQSIEDREVGGLGIFFVLNIMDDCHYDRKDGKNILTLKKTISV